MKPFIAIFLLSQTLISLRSTIFIFEGTLKREEACHPLNANIETIPEFIIRLAYAPPLLVSCLITYPINWEKE